jgi:hypothetical protein
MAPGPAGDYTAPGGGRDVAGAEAEATGSEREQRHRRRGQSRGGWRIRQPTVGSAQLGSVSLDGKLRFRT